MPSPPTPLTLHPHPPIQHIQPPSQPQRSQPQPQAQAPFPTVGMAQIPALHLYPLNDSFVPKQISLAQGRVRIGRQTNAKTVPGERNGYFDSKVLSRMHAEVWEESGKVLIKDVKSSNGTFINSERLSPEGVESEPFELKSEDIVEFGIDIVGEDNRTIVHHKVAAKVYCILAPDDLLASQREMQFLRNPSNRLPHPVINGSGPGQAQGSNGQGGGVNGVNGGPGQQQHQQQQAQQQLQPGSQQQQQQQAAQGQTLGGMGASRAPGTGKSGLTFDHLLSRLQGEIVKSRETGQDLNGLGREMGEIGETLSGGLPHHPPPPPSHPLQRDGSGSLNGQTQGAMPGPQSTALLSTLQNQLHETRQSLASHADKVRTLESLLAEHDALKREVAGMREAMEESRRALEGWRREREGRGVHGQERGEQEEGEGDAMDDNDDAKSVMTVTPDDADSEADADSEGEHEHVPNPSHEHEHEREADAEPALGQHELEAERMEEVHRPKTPEPTGHGLDDDDPPPLPILPQVESVPLPVPAQVQVQSSHVPASAAAAGLHPLPPSPPTAQPGLEDASVAAAASDYVTRSEQANHLSSLMTQISDLSLQLSTALTLSKELSSQQEVIRQLESRLAGYEEWKRNVDERVGGIQHEVRVVETWRKEREEERKREDEWEQEERDKLYALRDGAGAGAGAGPAGAVDDESPLSEDAPLQAPRPRRRRKSKGSRSAGLGLGSMNGSAASHVHVVGAPRSGSIQHGSSSPSSSSSETRSSGLIGQGTRRHLTRAGARGRSESQSTAVGSDIAGLAAGAAAALGLTAKERLEREGSEGDTLVESLPDEDGSQGSASGKRSLVDSPVSAAFPPGSGSAGPNSATAEKNRDRDRASGTKDLGTGVSDSSPSAQRRTDALVSPSPSPSLPPTAANTNTNPANFSLLSVLLLTFCLWMLFPKAVGNVVVPFAVVLIAGIAAWAVVNRVRD